MSTTEQKLQELRRRIDEAEHAGSARAVEKQHAKGKLTARERLDLLPYNEPGIASYLAGHGEPSNALVPLISLDEISTGHYLVMNKDSNPELVEQIRSAFQSLLDNGEFERILGPSLAR